MAKFDMTFPTSLQAACLEAERRIDRDIATVLRNATFLQEVADSTARERETEAFLRRIWNENPLYKLSTGSNSMDIATALTDAAFRQWFRELIDGPYPENPQERAAWLDDLMNKTKRRIWPNSPGSNVKTTRAFAALFPHDFTTHRSPGRKGGLYEVLSGAKNVRDEARVNRWILDRLDEAIGSVDRTDFNAVARRMMLPEILHEISAEQRQPSEPAPTVSSPDPALSVIWPQLPQIVKHFKSLREDGRLIFDQEVVESLHLGISAREQQHFAVLTGLSGTGKTQLAIEYAKAMTGDNGESNGRICKIAVQPSWYDPTPLLGYVNPLGESRYTATQFRT